MNNARHTVEWTENQEVRANRRAAITPAALTRWAGLAAMAAGILFIAIQPLHPPDTLASVTSEVYTIVHILTLAMSLFGLLGVTGIYARQATATGWLGLVGYLLFSLWLVLILGFTFAEAFILPPLAAEAPKFVESFMGIASGTAGEMKLETLATVYAFTGGLYVSGCLLLGIAIFRAGILSRWAAAILAGGAAAALATSFLPHELARYAAVPTGVGLAWLGYALLAERRGTS